MSLLHDLAPELLIEVARAAPEFVNAIATWSPETALDAAIVILRVPAIMAEVAGKLIVYIVDNIAADARLPWDAMMRWKHQTASAIVHACGLNHDAVDDVRAVWGHKFGELPCKNAGDNFAHVIYELKRVAPILSRDQVADMPHEMWQYICDRWALESISTSNILYQEMILHYIMRDDAERVFLREVLVHPIFGKYDEAAWPIVELATRDNAVNMLKALLAYADTYSEAIEIPEEVFKLGRDITAAALCCKCAPPAIRRDIMRQCINLVYSPMILNMFTESPDWREQFIWYLHEMSE